MARRDRESDWAERVPESRFRGPYRDYGWEAGQSALPEFRYPGSRLTPEERREVWDWQERSLRLSRESEGQRGRGRSRSQIRDRYFGEEYGREFAPEGYYAEAWGRGFDEEGHFNINRGWTMPGPYTGIGPRNYRRSDQQIYEEACERLTRHGQLDARDIELDVKDGEVTLKGTVIDRRAKHMAEDAIETISGVMDIHNQLNLRGAHGRSARWRDEIGETGVYPVSAGEAPDDAEVVRMAEWGQGKRGAKGYQDSGESELPTAEDTGMQ